MKSKPDLQMEINLRTKGWGISIQGDRLLLSAVRNRFNRLRFVGHAELANYPQKSDEEIREFIDEFVDEHRLKRGEAFLGLSRREVRVQMVEFPLEAAESLDEVLGYQIENLFPGNYDQYEFFHQILGRFDQLIVMVIAVKKEVMGRVFAEIRRWNLNLAGVALEPCALVNGLSRLAPEQFKETSYAVLHLLPGCIELDLVRDGRLVVTETIDWASDTLERDLVGGLERAFSAARLDPNDVDRYLLSGSPQGEEAQFLHDQVGIEFDTMEDSLGQSIPPEALMGASLAITGVFDKVALPLNLLPQNLRKRHRHLPLLIAAVLVMMAGSYFLYNEYRDYVRIKKDLEFVLNQSQRLKARVEGLSTVILEHETKQEEVTTYHKFRFSDGMSLKLLSELTQTLPDHTYLTSFSIRDGDQLTIQGESEEPFAVRSKLQSLPFLTNVDTKNAITPGRNPDKKKFTFGAKILLEELK